MTGSSAAGVITAIASLITAIGGTVAILKVLLPSLRIAKDTHTIVNQQRTDMERYQRVLENALKQAGLDVPQDQSKLD